MKIVKEFDLSCGCPSAQYEFLQEDDEWDALYHLYCKGYRIEGHCSSCNSSIEYTVLFQLLTINETKK